MDVAVAAADDDEDYDMLQGAYCSAGTRSWSLIMVEKRMRTSKEEEKTVEDLIRSLSMLGEVAAMS